MYDILQLNEMLSPELIDLGEKLEIKDSKKLDKKELIYKILDKQALDPNSVPFDENNKKAEEEKPKKPKKKWQPKKEKVESAEPELVIEKADKAEEQTTANPTEGIIETEAPKKVKKTEEEQKPAEEFKEEPEGDSRAKDSPDMDNKKDHRRNEERPP
ncbi:MAG TPA: hypothetical protein EYN39_02760, partial [Deltaproteobacteria bacterium]|nr:hypothetical protein [Deltaproteobacteria bacterium]